MSFQFTPIDQAAQQKRLPFFEEARADFAPYYSTTKKPDDVQAEIVTALGKLGGYGVYFLMGKFGEKPTRYGYEVRFTLNGAPGLFRVAGMPMRTEDAKKRDRVLAQALCIVREWVTGMVTAKLFMPGTEPLAQYLLVDGDNTITDFIISRGKLPELPKPKVDVLDGEVVG